MGYDKMYASAKTNLPDSQTRAEWNAMSKEEKAQYTKTRSSGSDTKSSYSDYRMKRLLSQMRYENTGLH